MTVYLLLGITYGFAAAVQPGPFQTFLISRTLSNGWRYTLLATCAPLLTDIPVIILALLVLNSVPDWMEQFLHIAGGLFVLYLAYGALKSFRNYNVNQAALPQSSRQNFLKAITVNLLNPNPYLSWTLVMGPLLLQGWRETPGNGVTLIIGFYLTFIFITDLIVILFGSLRRFGPKVSKVLIGISAIALAGFGFYQLWLGLSPFFSAA